VIYVYNAKQFNRSIGNTLLPNYGTISKNFTIYILFLIMCIILPLFVSIYNVDFLIIPGLLPLILTTDFKPKSGHIIF